MRSMFDTVEERALTSMGLTLERARARLAAADGVACPCCGQWVKTYRRVLNSQMAHFIIRLYRHLGKTGNEYALSRDFLDAGHKASSDGTYLRLWNLIRPHRDDRGRTIKGEWGITPEGVAFVDARMTVNQAVYIRAGKVLRFDKDQTDIKEALGRKFDYDELMGRERKDG